MEYISIILTAVFILFLAIGFLLGFKRGIKRTLVRSIWIVVLVILLALVSMNITKLIFDMRFNITIQGEKYVTIRHYINSLLSNALPMEGGDYSGIVNLIIIFLSLIINMVVFLIAYWVLKLITLVLYYILNIFIFSRERRIIAKAKKERKRAKIKKYRLAGGFLGIFMGLLSFCVTITPVIGYVSIAKRIETSTINEEGVGLISDTIGDTYNAIIEEYEESVPIKVLETVALDKALNALFNGISSVNVTKDKIYLSDEAVDIAKAYVNIREVKIPNLNKATAEEISIFLDQADVVVDSVFESKLVNASVNTIVPFAAKYIRQQIDTTEFKPYALDFYNAFFDQFEGLNALTTKQEIKVAINLIRVLNKNNLFLPIIQDNMGDDVAEYLKLNLTKPAVDEVMANLFALSTVSTLSPAMVNFLLGAGSEKLGYGYSNENYVLASTLKTSATNILYSTVDLLETYDADKTTKVDLNRTTIGAFGNILDEIKMIVNQQNFREIVNSIEPKLDKLANDAMPKKTPQFLKDTAQKAIDNLSEIGGFNVALTNLYDAYEIVIDQFETAKLEGENKYDVELMDFVKLGEALNKFQNSELVGRILFLDTMKDAVIYYIEIAEEKLEIEEVEFRFSFDDVVLENIEELKLTGLDWEIELPIYKRSAGLVANLLQDTRNIVKRLRSESDPTIEEFGYELEHNLKNSVLLGGADRLLASDLFQIADYKIELDDEELDESLSTLIRDARENVMNEQNLNWEMEAKHIKKIAMSNINSFSDEDVSSGAELLDTIVFDTLDDDGQIVKKSSILKQDMVNQFIVDYIDSMFKDIEEGETFYSSIQKIKLSIIHETITSYTYEFNAILKLKSVKEITSKSDFKFKENGIEIGRKIDEALAVGVVDGVDPKVVVTQSLINHFIQNETENYFASYSKEQDEIEKIKAGFDDDVELYEVEFTAIKNLIDASDTINAKEFDFNDRANASQLGKHIDDVLGPINVGAVNYYSKVIDRELINGYIKEVIDEKITITNEKFSTVKTSIIGEKNVEEGTYGEGRLDTFTNSYESEFGYLAQLSNISKNFSDIKMSTLNTPNSTTGTTLAEEYDGSVNVPDPLKHSQLVGDSLLVAIEGAIDTYSEDPSNMDYVNIIAEVESNYAVVRQTIYWASNSDAVNNYTFLIAELTAIDEAINGDLTKDIEDLSQVSTMANTYDGTLQELQENVLLSVKGTNELAQVAMNKVIEKMSEQVVQFKDAIEYANNYVNYLKLAKTTYPTTAQPYNLNTETVVYKLADGSWSNVQPTEGEYTAVRVNKPFAKVGELIDSALGA